MLKRLRKLFGSAKSKDAPPAAPEGEAGFPPETPAARRTSGVVAVHRGPAVVHRPIPESDLDPDAVRIIRRLMRFNYTAYLVGGCVRDLLLERSPKDFDIATSATPRQVKRLFSNCRIIGRRFRLAHVYFQNGKIIEVATFRARDIQADAADEAAEANDESDDLMIRDDNVFGSPEDDAVRRDFTVNQLFYDVASGNVLDHADGLGDLRRHLVRTIGDPDVRFREDPIRILRAVKFAARLGFEIEPATREALMRTRREIPKAASPRILEELNRFCRGGAGRRSFEMMLETGVFAVVLPELADEYAAPEGEARALLFSLLEVLDARADTGTIAPGEIFACLLAPVLVAPLGLDSQGPIASSGRSGPPPRDVVDVRLRPIALRLRMSRRDQEHCRQAILTLQRVAAGRALRRAARATMVRRPSFADALFLLRALADRWGGAYGEALSFWSSGENDGDPSSRAVAPAPELARAEREGGDGRKRRRRGGRGRRGAGGTARPNSPIATAESAPRGQRPPSPGATKQPGPGAGAPRMPHAVSGGTKLPADGAAESKLPPVWDDNYFFAALPTVPQLEADEAGSDRYGARALAVATEIASDGEDGGDGAPSNDRAAGAPRKRRRSRRGRGRSGGGSAPPTQPAD